MKKFKVLYKYIGVDSTIIEANNTVEAREIFNNRINSCINKGRIIAYGICYEVKILSITNL